MTQKEKILKRIKQRGYVDNFWAIQNNILRLSERVRELKAAGTNMLSLTGAELDKPKRYRKNQYYFIIVK